jgi:hypothetical protein
LKKKLGINGICIHLKAEKNNAEQPTGNSPQICVYLFPCPKDIDIFFSFRLKLKFMKVTIVLNLYVLTSCEIERAPFSIKIALA